jgi:hypothetical protein
MDSGKKYLVEAFYASIVKQTPVPIPYRQILLTSRIMDSIFKQVAFDQSVRPKQLSVVKKETDVRAGAVLERRL